MDVALSLLSGWGKNYGKCACLFSPDMGGRNGHFYKILLHFSGEPISFCFMGDDGEIGRMEGKRCTQKCQTKGDIACWNGSVDAALSLLSGWGKKYGECSCFFSSDTGVGDGSLCKTLLNSLKELSYCYFMWEDGEVVRMEGKRCTQKCQSKGVIACWSGLVDAALSLLSGWRKKYGECACFFSPDMGGRDDRLFKIPLNSLKELSYYYFMLRAEKRWSLEPDSFLFLFGQCALVRFLFFLFFSFFFVFMEGGRRGSSSFG